MAQIDKTYDDGLRDGKIQSLEDMAGYQNKRLDGHSGRLSNLERTSYLMIGAIVFIEFFPQLKGLFGG